MPDRYRPRVKNQALPAIDSIPVRTRPEDLGLARKKEQTPQPQVGRVSPQGEELKGVYIISVAARLLAMHPQTLRKYERLGLVRPARTIGMLRLYSEVDIDKLRLIKHLEENLGLNLAGVEFTLNLLSHLVDMRQRIGRAKDAQHISSIVEREMAQLFHRLNLPLEE